MDEYLPLAYRDRDLPEISLLDLTIATSPAVTRNVRLLGGRYEGDLLRLRVEGADLVLNPDVLMGFGTEMISIRNYIKLVLDAGDLIDIVVDPSAPTRYPYIWIHIDYIDGDAGASFSRKDDGLFALRARAGEKAERRVAAALTSVGHQFISSVASDRFEIRYEGKKKRTPDLRCSLCSTQFEVKKRNWDWRRRVSHSAGRSFADENAPTDWHAFVFHDGSIHYIQNAHIIAELAMGNFIAGSDEYDAWVDLTSATVASAPPPCV